MSPLQWDLLAPAWHHLEESGLRDGDLEQFAHRFRGPSLLIGAGQGLVVTALQRFAPPVLAIDRSLPMAHAAWKRRRARLTVADGRALPARDRWARSVVVSSGVLDPSRPELESALLGEVARVLAPGGAAVFCGFVPTGKWAVCGQELGLLEERVQRNDRLLDLWRAARHSGDVTRLVAGWIGCPEMEARRRLEKHRATVLDLILLFDRIAQDLHEQGRDPWAVLQAGYAGPFPLESPERLVRIVEAAGFKVEDASDPALSHSLLLLLCRKEEPRP